MSLRRFLAALILGALLALPVLILFPPWIFAYGLTHPACRSPAPLDRLPAPAETSLHTPDGLVLRAWYYPSQNGAAVIALGGMGGSLGTGLPPVEMLAARGYGILQIDGRACARPPAPVTLGYRESEEALAGLVFLQSRPEIHPGRIGIFGFSMGAAAALRLAGVEPEIRAVVAEGGYSNLGENFEGYGAVDFPTRAAGFFAKLGYRILTGADPALSSPVNEIALISPRPVLLIYGEGENGPPAAALWEAAGPPKELWIVPGGSHGANHQAAPDEYERRVVEFFNQALLTAPD